MKTNIKNPFINKNVRSWYNKANNTYYYCANDVCSVLTDGTYYQGKNYWKSLKSRNNKFNMNRGHKRTQMKLPAKDGKFYLYDVIDHKQLIYIIKLICHKNSVVFKCWLGLLSKFEIRERIIEVLGLELRAELVIKITSRFGYAVGCVSYIKKWFKIGGNYGCMFDASL